MVSRNTKVDAGIEPIKMYAFFFIGSILVVLMVSRNTKVDAGRLREVTIEDIQRIECKGTVYHACNYIGSYCHAEVLNNRRKRSTTDNKKSHHCKLCRIICYNKM